MSAEHTNPRPGEENTGAGARSWEAVANVSPGRPRAFFGFSFLQCPDCAARPVDHVLTHADTCPLNRAINAVIDGDRDWFAAHPGATARRRPVTAAEVADCSASGLGRPVGMVTVHQLAPGPRSREFEYADGAR